MTCHRLGHVSPELRAALDDPRTRYRIVDAWRARVKAEIKGETTDDRLLADAPPGLPLVVQ